MTKKTKTKKKASKKIEVKDVVKKEEKPVGRPTTFCQKFADEICERLSDGESLRQICSSEKMPSKTTVFKWLAKEENKEFVDQYARAREAQVENFIDEMIDIADDGSNDYMTIRKGKYSYEVENREVTSRSKMRIEARQWAASKLLPKKYGAKATLAGDPENPLNFVPVIKDDIK